jgi:hypothetical protein
MLGSAELDGKHSGYGRIAADVVEVGILEKYVFGNADENPQEKKFKKDFFQKYR